MCIPRRLVRAFMVKDYEKVEEIIKKVDSVKVSEISDLDLYRHLSSAYQNVIFLTFKKARNFNVSLIELHGKI